MKTHRIIDWQRKVRQPGEPVCQAQDGLATTITANVTCQERLESTPTLQVLGMLHTVTENLETLRLPDSVRELLRTTSAILALEKRDPETANRIQGGRPTPNSPWAKAGAVYLDGLVSLETHRTEDPAKSLTLEMLDQTLRTLIQARESEEGDQNGANPGPTASRPC